MVSARASCARTGLVLTCRHHLGAAEPIDDLLDPLIGGDVVGDDDLGLDPGDGERERDDHAGPVLARRAVHDGRPGGGDDRAQRAHHLLGPVLQVAEVVAGHQVVGVPLGILLLGGEEQRGRDGVGGVEELLEHRVVRMRTPSPRRAGPALDHQLPGRAQVHHRRHADLVDQQRDVLGGQLLEVLERSSLR